MLENLLLPFLRNIFALWFQLNKATKSLSVRIVILTVSAYIMYVCTHIHTCTNT